MSFANKHRKQWRNEWKARCLFLGLRRFPRPRYPPKGFITLKSNIPPEQLEAFRKQWYAMISGPNAVSSPVFANEADLEWEPIVASPKDLAYQQHKRRLRGE